VGQVVYDVGANTGIHSLLFSRLVGPGGSVYAFEPLSENILEIESIKRLNAASNIVVVAEAIGDRYPGR
jgi:FkbM family methyltransferase